MWFSASLPVAEEVWKAAAAADRAAAATTAVMVVVVVGWQPVGLVYRADLGLARVTGGDLQGAAGLELRGERVHHDLVGGGLFSAYSHASSAAVSATKATGACLDSGLMCLTQTDSVANKSTAPHSPHLRPFLFSGPTRDLLDVTVFFLNKRPLT